MARWIFLCLAWSCLPAAFGEEPGVKSRPITEAESVLAVYYENWGLGADNRLGLIFAAWPNGDVVWSGDHLKGGAPFRHGNIEVKKIPALLERLDKDGLLSDEKLNKAHFGPDSAFITVLIKSGKKELKLKSWHELMEETGNLVCTEHGAMVLGNRKRLDVLRTSSADYLFYRMVWSETRTKLSELIPAESKASTGKPVMKAGVLTWEEKEGPAKK